MTRGQGQSPALEGSEQANFRVTPHLPRGGRSRKSGRLGPALHRPPPRLLPSLPSPSPAPERATPFDIRSRPAGHAPALWQGNPRCLTLPAGKAGAPALRLGNSRCLPHPRGSGRGAFSRSPPPLLYPAFLCSSASFPASRASLPRCSSAFRASFWRSSAA